MVKYLVMNEDMMLGEADDCHMRFNMGSLRSAIEQTMRQLE